MNEDRAGRELVAQFHRLMDHEPPFRTDLDEALRAAERGGRRRRTRTLAVRGGATALAIAASTALVIAWPSQDRALNSPPAVVPTEVSPTTAQPLDPIDRLERLAREIARPSGGSVKVRWDAALEEMYVTAKTRDGSFEVAADRSGERSDLETWQESCRLESSRCTQLSFTPAMGVWAWTTPGQPGRQTLRVTAMAPDEEWLSIIIENYVEMADGSKKIGPSWKDAGITVSGLRKAVADSGLSSTG